MLGGIEQLEQDPATGMTTVIGAFIDDGDELIARRLLVCLDRVDGLALASTERCRNEALIHRTTRFSRLSPSTIPSKSLYLVLLLVGTQMLVVVL